MSFSSSKPQNSTATTTSLTTVNENVSGNSGLTTIAKDSEINLSYAPVNINTDAGAVNAGAYVANAGISAATSAAALAVNALGRADDNIRSLAADVVTRNSDLALQSQNRAFDIIQAAGSSLADAEHEYGQTLKEYQLASQAQLGNVVSALGQSFVENNRSADQQVISAVASSGDNLVKGVKYLAIAAAVATLAFVVIRHKG